MFQHFSKHLQRKSGKPVIDFSGTWVNELGSEMEITVNDGKVMGKYRSAVGEASPTERFELTGFTSGDRIAFCVDFGAYGTLAAWTGLHSEDNGVEAIYALWHLPREIGADEDAKDYRWSAILTGVNTFKRKRIS
jgi:hypothetical protein